MLIWDAVDSEMFEQSPHRQPRRNRLPHHPHASSAWAYASVAVYSDADRLARTCDSADEAVRHRPGAGGRELSELEAILAAARPTGADAVHPGYGFLSENAASPRRCEDAGIAFIGPTPEQMRAFGLKHTRARARRCKPACRCCPAPGCSRCRARDWREPHASAIRSCSRAPRAAAASACSSAASRTNSCRASSASSAWRATTSARRRVHRALRRAGAPRRGADLRRRQGQRARARRARLLGAAAQPEGLRGDAGAGLPEAMRARLLRAACRLGEIGELSLRRHRRVHLRRGRDDFFFLEVNTRLQVEHGVTEVVTGIDLVEWMVRQAAGDMAPLDQASIEPRGVAIQARVYAEDPGRDFRPSCGLLTEWPGPTIRASTPGSRAAPRCRRSTIRCWPRSSSSAPTATRRSRAASRARRDRDRRHRDQPRLPPPALASRRSRARRGADADARRASPTAPTPSRCWRRAPRPRCRTSRAASATGTSACRPPGRWTALLPPRQPPRRQREDAAGLEITVSGPTLNSTATRYRLGRRRTWRDARRRAGRPIGSRSPSRPDRC